MSSWECLPLVLVFLNVKTSLPLFLLEKEEKFTPANLEILSFKHKRQQHLKLRNLASFYAWEDARFWAH